MKGYFLIRSVFDQTNAEQIIPKDLLSLETTQSERNRSSVNQLASRIWFMTDDLLRVVNKQGQDVLFDAKTMKIVSIVGIDNFNPKNFEDPHYIRE